MYSDSGVKIGSLKERRWKQDATVSMRALTFQHIQNSSTGNQKLTCQTEPER
jgi:hypothetical protein